MNRLLVFLFLAMSFGVYAVGCANNQAQSVAELLTALSNKIDTSVLVGPSPAPTLNLPNQVSCNSDVFTLDTSGSLAIEIINASNLPSPTSSTGMISVGMNITAQLNVEGPGLSAGNTTANTTSTATQTATGSTPTPTSTIAATDGMTCGFSAIMNLQAATSRLNGVPQITNCANYECIVNSQVVKCVDVQNALAKLAEMGGCQ